MKILRFAYYLSFFFILFCAVSSVETVTAQKKMDRIERGRIKTMLGTIKNAIKKDYYDPNFHGIDLDARFKKAEERLDQVDTTGQALGVIAQVLMDFNDSHLYFQPPATNLDVEYGWRLRMYGDKCFVTLVKPKSDAEAKGLKVGDQIVSIEGFRPNRKDLWKMMYYYNILSKRPKIKMTVLSPGDAQPRDLEIDSKIKQLANVITVSTLMDLFDSSGKLDIDYNYFRNVGKIAIWKMPSFSVEPPTIDVAMDKIKGSAGLILDLRSNSGGYVVTLERLAGYMFDRDLKIADLKGRKPLEPQESKTRGNDVYKGKLIVLIDSNSGSAAEIFARLVQLEKRGTVIGDVSAGAVMQSRGFGFETDNVLYGVSITHADVIMSDGKSLENVGVIPDELVLPTGADLAAQKDPILARAIELLGGNVSAADAGKFFVYKWKENDRIVIDVQ